MCIEGDEMNKVGIVELIKFHEKDQIVLVC